MDRICKCVSTWQKKILLEFYYFDWTLKNLNHIVGLESVLFFKKFYQKVKKSKL